MRPVKSIGLALAANATGSSPNNSVNKDINVATRNFDITMRTQI